jgi:hypothetical protein
MHLASRGYPATFPAEGAVHAPDSRCSFLEEVAASGADPVAHPRFA